MIDHASIIRDVIERNKKTFKQTTLDFNKQEKTAIERYLDIKERLSLQRQVKLSEIKIASLEDVKLTLPYLLHHQHEDVVKAERWLWKLGQKAILFSNSVGTGKTFVSGGIIFRHQGNILIIVPSDKKCLDWQEELRLLSLKVNKLESITDKGKEGINITTYANFRQNNKLQEREWDMVFYDECHYIMSNEQGEETLCLQAHRKTTNHSSFVRENAEVKLFGKRPTKEREVYAYNRLLADNADKINEEMTRLSQLTKLVFLSATPFPYRENLDYADGYLFDMGSDERKDGLPSERDMFFIDNFGYKFERGKLVLPDVGTDINELERAFADKLLSSGAMSTRKIQLQYDYSREFIKL